MQENGEITITVLPLERNLGEIFLLLPDIFGIIGYLFAKPESDNLENGFSIAGEYLIATSIIDFQNDEGM